MKTRAALIVLALLYNLPFAFTQETATSTSLGSVASSVPRLIRFSGALKSADGKPLSGTIGITFFLYRDQQGGAPLWMETQNVQPDATGHYSVQLGATQANGLPTDVFASGEARWLGVQAQGQAEQPRVMLLAVPYALKAADAETLAGKPLSSFQLVPPQSKNSSGTQKALLPAEQLNEIACAGSTACKTSFIPKFSTNGGSATVNNSVISQSGTIVSIAGSESVLGSVSSHANVSATGNVSGKNISAKTGSFSQSSDGPTLKVTNSGNGDGIDISTTTGDGIRASSTGFGGDFSGAAAGINTFNPSDIDFFSAIQAVAGGTTSKTIGVNGYSASPFGAGVYGSTVSGSNEGSKRGGSAGVWGDSGVSGDFGVLGTTDDGFSIIGYNNSDVATVTAINESTGTTATVFYAYGSQFGGLCTIDVKGHLVCNGTMSAVVPLDNGSRKAALYAVEAPENWFEDAGSGQLSNGQAVVKLEPTFSQTVNTGMEYHVFLTPKGDCEGLYVSNETSTGFEVHELRSGRSNVAFDYRIMAKRKGYENIRLADKTKMFDAAAPKLASRPGTRPPSAQEIRERNRQMLMRPVTQLGKPNLKDR